MSDPLPEPNWVQECAECDVDSTYNKLVKEAKKDVEKANVFLGAKNDTVAFDCQDDSSAHNQDFKVRRLVNGKHQDTVLYENLGWSVKISNLRGLNISVVPKWNSLDCKCELHVSTTQEGVVLGDPVAPEILELWEISKKALEPLFFV